MPAVVKIDFRVSGIADVQRAFASISGSAQRVAAAGVRAQRAAGQQQVAAAKQAGSQMLSDAEANAKAEIAIIKRVNKAHVDAARERVRLTGDVAAANARLVQAQEQAARASNRTKYARGAAEGAVGGFKRGAGAIAGVAGLAGGMFGTHTVIDAARSQMDLEQRGALLANASDVDKSKFDSVAKAKELSNLTGVDAGAVMGGFEKLSGKAGGEGLVKYEQQFVSLAKIAKGAGVSMDDMGDVLGTLANRGIAAENVVDVIKSLVQQGKNGAVEFKDLATMLDASSGALGKFKMNDATRVMTAGGLSQFARKYGKKSPEEATDAVGDLARDLGGKAEAIQKLTGGSLTRVHVKGKKTKKMVGGKMVETTEGDSTKDTYAGGVEVGTDSSRAQLRDVNTLLPDIIEGASKAGNLDKLIGEGGFSGNSTAILGPLIQAFTSGLKKNKSGTYDLVGEGETGDIQGRAAVETLLKQFNEATMAAGADTKAFGNVMATSSAKLDVAMAKMKNDLGDKLAPAISGLIPHLATLGAAFGQAVATVAETPKQAIVGFLALNTALGLAQGALGKLGGSLLDKILPKAVSTMQVNAAAVNVAGGSGMPGGPSVMTDMAGAWKASGALGKFGVAVAGAAGSAVAFTAAFGATWAMLEGLDSLFGESTKKRRKAAENPINESVDLAFKIRQGKASNEDIKKAQVVMGKLNKAKEDSTWYDKWTGGKDDQTGERADAAAKQLMEAFATQNIKLDPNAQVQLSPGASVTVSNLSDLTAQLPKVQTP